VRRLNGVKAELFRLARKILAVTLPVSTLLSVWMWWEAYTASVDWRKRHRPFHLPFYAWSPPNWFVIDLAILIIVVSSVLLTILAVSA